jgi:hypothetical protein
MENAMKKKGLLLRADDLEAGRLVTIHHWRDCRRVGMGRAYRIRAVNLPYAVLQPLGAENDRRFTLDLRRAVLMPITEEYAQAQAEGPPPECENAPSPGDTDGIPF